MARIPHADETANPEIRAFAEQIRAERHDRISHICRMLLDSPEIARGWLNPLTAVRHETTLAGRYRELVLVRLADIDHAACARAVPVPLVRQEGRTVSREAGIAAA